MPKQYPRNAKGYYTFFKVPSSQELTKMLEEQAKRIKEKLLRKKEKKYGCK